MKLKSQKADGGGLRMIAEGYKILAGFLPPKPCFADGEAHYLCIIVNGGYLLTFSANSL